MDRQILPRLGASLQCEGPDGLIDRKTPRSGCEVDARAGGGLVKLVEDGPVPAIHGVFAGDWSIWRAGLRRIGVTLSVSSLGRILNNLGYRKLRPDPNT